ncbi:MAG TPA: hypothetical protein VF158_10610 [Longimicrobiales bacterium]
MNRIGGIVAAAAVFAAAPATRAQEIAGSGAYASPLFHLDAGLAVFELEHRGPGRFTVVLLDDRADVVARLAEATGAFTGSTAVRIPHDGRYLLDIDADGAWTIRLRDAPAGVFRLAEADASPIEPTPSADARLAGEAAAGGWSWGWFARGLAGGALAGPIGAGFVVHRAGRSEIPPPPDPAAGPDAASPRYIVDYRNAYANRLVARRRTAAFAGGIIGSAAFLVTLLQWIDVSGDGGASGSPPGPEPQLSLTIVVRP